MSRKKNEALPESKPEPKIIPRLSYPEWLALRKWVFASTSKKAIEQMGKAAVEASFYPRLVQKGLLQEDWHITPLGEEVLSQGIPR